MTLEEVIRNQLQSAGATFHDADALDMAIHDTANAVRAFLGSDEVERVVAEAVSRARCNAGRPDAGKGLDEFIARAALSSIGGE